MKFAFSIPVKSHAHLLAGCLESLRRQDEGVRIGLLDASFDPGVPGILARYTDMIDYAYHRRDGGQAEAINSGWSHLDADIYGWLNADDLLRPGILGRVAQTFNANPAVDVVFGHAVHVDMDGRFLEYFPAIEPDANRLRDGCSIAQPACFVRGQVLQRTGCLDPALHYAMDWDLWLRLLAGGARFAFMDDVIAAVRIHDATKTSSFSLRRYREIQAVARRANTGARATVIAARFLCSDILRRRNGNNWVAAARRAMAGAKAGVRGATARSIRGLAPGRNWVEQGCELILPTFDEGSLCARVWVDQPGIYLDQVAQAERIAQPMEGTDDSVFGRGYAVEVAVTGHDWRVVRVARPGGAWRLLGAELRAGTDAARDLSISPS